MIDRLLQIWHRLRDWWRRPTNGEFAALLQTVEEQRDRIWELEDRIERSRREREPDSISDDWQSVTIWPQDIRPWYSIREPMGFDRRDYYTYTIHTALKRLLDQVITCSRCRESAGIRQRLWRPVTDVDGETMNRFVEFYTVCALCATPTRHAAFYVDWRAKTAEEIA